MAAGDFHAIVLTSDNYLYAWGSSNSYCQFGTALSASDSPILVTQNYASKNITALLASGLSSHILTSQGELYSWGVTLGSVPLSWGCTAQQSATTFIQQVSVSANFAIFQRSLTCFGHLATGSTVCSFKNGSCADVDSCACNQNRTGSECQYYTCNGKSNVDPTVCSGRAPCLISGLCQCPSNYSGLSCEGYWCDNVSSLTSSVCSGHGTCGSTSSCTCATNYVGSNCNITSCNNVFSNSSSVCSSRGSCPSYNLCSCNSGYTGSNCEHIICYNQLSNSGTVCSGHGICNAPNFCTCSGQYIGNECQVPLCGGIYGNSTSVCNGNGVCLSNNTCSCTFGKTGALCEDNICFGLAGSSAQVCSYRNGTCSSLNFCQCNNGYTGSQCEVPICFGSISNFACSGNGNCLKKDSCLCNDGYVGTKCEVPLCNGILGNTSQVCSGRGSCISNNSCQCSTGYIGQNCESVLCHGIVSTNASVCSSHGSCISPGVCNCSQGYTGITCAYPLCYSVPSNSATVCSGHGICNSVDSCQCSANFFGRNCSVFSCFGILANSTLVCNRHGSCTGVNTCACESNFVGSDCSIPICNGRNASDPFVCSQRGTCTAPNLCTCNNGYFGNICQHTTCFNVESYNAKVCSSKGICQALDSCACKTNFQGPQCQVTSCFGLLSNDTRVCSASGTCIDYNLCYCNMNRGGQNCSQQAPTCFGTSANSDSVCSNRQGHCFADNVCTCKPGFAGVQCEQHTCFGISSTDAAVCSAHGVCASRNSCLCDAGYSFPDCSQYSCYDVPFNASNVCSNHGICLAADNCSCSFGYTGLACDAISCYGYAYNHPLVCSAKGSCLAPNQCNCSENYSGEQCQNTNQHTCFGFAAQDSRACGGKGNCTSMSVCTCSTGYFGSQCEIPSCFGILATERQVCGGFGYCSAPNNCTCFPEYTGSDCTNYTCYGISKQDAQVCSGHGICSSLNNCKCANGYANFSCADPICFGNFSYNACSSNGNCTAPSVCNCKQNYSAYDCSQYYCDNISYQNSTVCSGKGKCVAPGICACNDGFLGQFCNVTVCTTCAHGICLGNNTCSCFASPTMGYWDGTGCATCALGYTGSLCTISECSPAVCNYRGSCLANNTCSCYDNDLDGHFTGVNCNSCKANYFGSNCSTFCSPAETCNSNGKCHNDGKCACFASFETGYFNPYKSCAGCAEGFFGPTCKSFVAQTFTMSTNYGSISGSMYLENLDPTAYNCTTLLHPLSMAKIGQDAVCKFISATSIEILLTEAASIVPGDFIMVAYVPSGSMSPVYKYVSIVPERDVSITIRIQSPVSVGYCSDVTLDASSSYSTAKTQMSFFWKAVSGMGLLKINMLLKSITYPIVTIPSHLLQDNSSYVFMLTVTVQGKSTLQSVTIHKKSSILLVPYISGPNPLRTSRINSVTLNGGIIDSCNQSVFYTWKQISGSPVHFTPSLNTVSIASFAFPFAEVERSFIFQMTASLSNNPLLSASSTVTIIVVPEQLRAIIAGGSRNVTRNVPFILDGSSSTDVEKTGQLYSFVWKCTLLPNLPCLIAPATLEGATITATLPLAGVYRFTLTFIVGVRSASASVDMTCSEIPATSYQLLLPYAITDSQQIFADRSIGNASVTWTFSSSSVFFATNFIYSNTIPFTNVSPKSLPATPVTITMSAKQGANMFTVSNTIAAIVYPNIGPLLVYPSSGFSSSTVFTMAATNVEDIIPLMYRFGYTLSNGDRAYFTAFVVGSSYKSTLPMGATSIFVDARNSNGVVSSRMKPVQVSLSKTRQSSITLVDAKLSELASASSKQDVVGTTSVSNFLSLSMLPAQNCLQSFSYCSFGCVASSSSDRLTVLDKQISALAGIRPFVTSDSLYSFVQAMALATQQVVVPLTNSRSVVKLLQAINMNDTRSEATDIQIFKTISNLPRDANTTLELRFMIELVLLQRLKSRSTTEFQFNSGDFASSLMLKTASTYSTPVNTTLTLCNGGNISVWLPKLFDVADTSLVGTIHMISPTFGFCSSCVTPLLTITGENLPTNTSNNITLAFSINNITLQKNETLACRHFNTSLQKWIELRIIEYSSSTAFCSTGYIVGSFAVHKIVILPKNIEVPLYYDARAIVGYAFIPLLPILLLYILVGALCDWRGSVNNKIHIDVPEDTQSFFASNLAWIGKILCVRSVYFCIPSMPFVLLTKLQQHIVVCCNVLGIIMVNILLQQNDSSLHFALNAFLSVILHTPLSGILLTLFQNSNLKPAVQLAQSANPLHIDSRTVVGSVVSSKMQGADKLGLPKFTNIQHPMPVDDEEETQVSQSEDEDPTPTFSVFRLVHIYWKPVLKLILSMLYIVFVCAVYVAVYTAISSVYKMHTSFSAFTFCAIVCSIVAFLSIQKQKVMLAYVYILSISYMAASVIVSIVYAGYLPNNLNWLFGILLAIPMELLVVHPFATVLYIMLRK